ncbi:hypothetical protein BDW74DRAFT_181118 [Aspergillus multicolor]|uniref:putative telomere length regulator protein (Rif1) n=1 Tax=Aspergillus multicolor TaxID=41759 RepID=UPI003CCE0ECC
MVDVLGPLSARPPTPPRTASRMLSEKDRTEDSPAPVQTPNESLFLKTESTGAPSSRKRVNFSPWPRFIKPPSFTNPDPKALLPSNDSKPARSILKATNSPGPISFAPPIAHTPESFVMLLRSVTQQLAGVSISSRIDAYMQFFGALRAYEKVPTEEEIVRNLSLIAEFIQRDISRDLTEGGPLDSTLVIQALKLSMVLIWHPQISPQLPDDFKLFLVEHSVNCLENGNLPKSVMTHFLSVLSTQKFSAKIITAARTTRILEMLYVLTDKVKGNSAVSQRLAIYERLFDVSKPTFLASSVLWMDHLISGLLHPIKNIRLSALELGFNVYMASGSNSTLSKTLRDIFDRPIADKRKMVSEVSERMSRMMGNSDTGEHVPQIWGVITLLLRNKRFNIDQWQHFKEWVLVLQKCFNCNDIEIKSKAIVNWNRFVLVANINETTSRSLLRMLGKPILAQFERRKHERLGSQPSQLVVSSYYNLLYYAFRPDASHQQLDMAWAEYVSLPSVGIFAFVPSLSDRSAHALSNMLWISHPLKSWSENRVNEPKKIVAEELPPLDCKWVRSSLPEVLKVFEAIFKSSVWEPELECSNIAAAWVSLSRALAFAASKEITPSTESMHTVAQILALFQRIWQGGPSSLNAVDGMSMDTFYERFRFLSTTMIIALGSISFTEKQLSKADTTYMTVTPSTRHLKDKNIIDTPILHLLRLLGDTPEVPVPTAAYSRLVKHTIEAACHGKGSRGPRLDILRQCADLYPDGDGSDGLENVGRTVWMSAAQLSADCLSSFAIESARERDGSVSRDYDNAVKILSVGLKFSDGFQIWDQLLGALFHVLKSERGDCAIGTIVLEPVVGLIMNLDVRTACSPASSMIHHCLAIPFSEHERDANDTNTPPFPSSLVTMAHRMLLGAYELLVPLHSNGAAIFIETLVAFLGSGTYIFRSVLLDHLQHALGLILRDESCKIPIESGAESRILTACHALASAVLNILQILPRYASTTHKFEPIISSGLRSSHISTAHRFRDFWKSSFGTQYSLLFPDSICQALQDLEARVDGQTQELRAGTAQLSQSMAVTGVGQDDRESNSLVESSTVVTKDLSVKSRIAFILDAPSESPQSARLESPVISETEVTTMQPNESRQQTESRLPQVLPQQVPSNTTEVGKAASGNEDTSHHQQMFSIIDNLRSSSPPTTTPKELGFRTPPHIRSLRNDECGSATPQTPTIPANPGDNEDGFLGSSPTPAIRGRTSSVASAIPPSFPAGDNMDIDPPSSPPQLEAQSADSQSVDSQQTSPSKSTRTRSAKNKKRSKSRRSKTPSKEKPAAVSSQGEPTEQNNEDEAEQSMRSRLRSATDKSPAKDVDAPAQETEEAQETTQTMCIDTVHDSTAASAAEPKEVPEPQLERDDPALESGGEDTDTQVTSQLEQDLVYAVDLHSDSADKEAAESTEQVAVTRKRKREEEASTEESKKERRRSTRISSAASPVAEAEAENAQAAPKKQKTTTASEDTISSPANTASKKRKNEAVKATAETPKQDQAKTGKEVAKEPQSQGSQQRRSHRISGVPAPDIPEETPAPRKSPRSTPSGSQSRKQSKKEKERNRRAQRRRSQRTAAAAAAAAPQEVITEGEGSIEKPDEPSQPFTMDEDSQEQPQPDDAVQLDQPDQQVEAPQEPVDTQMAETAATEPEPAAVAEPEAPPEAEPEAEAEVTSNHQPFESAIELQTPSEPAQPPQPLPAVQESAPAPAPASVPEPETAAQTNHDVPISTSLRSLIDQVKSSSLDRNTVKEMDDLLFDLRFEMHEALRRHCNSDTAAPTASQ